MSLHPNVQRKAQEELDRVVGPGRLPDFDDYDSLIYVRAIYLECMRWVPVTPMGVPHTLTRDDEYKGCFIPKGTTIIAVSGTTKNTDLPYVVPKLYRTNGGSSMILFFTGVG